MKYDDFLARKRLIVQPSGLDDPGEISEKLFPFQRDVVRWALRIGKAAIWEDCGLGKSFQALEWARHVTEHTGGQVLILTPLAVARQFVSEGEKFGIPVHLVREQQDCGIHSIVVTNYDRLHKFDLQSFAGVVADESSILKSLDGKTRTTMIREFAQTPYKLCCTATPAPNDFMELGNHSEFLGSMTRAEMLAMFFVHDGGSTQDWRLKGHAQEDFWRWLSSWAVNLRKPSDLGYDDDGFLLPPLTMHQHVVKMDQRVAHNAGMLFVEEARTLNDQRAARRATIDQRVKLTADLVNSTDRPWLVWCDLNAESAALAKAIPDAVEVKGADSSEHKESALWGFACGEHRVLVSKPKIAGWGMNFQRCSDVAFVGIGHSFESWYQAVRRSYRFGQEREVNCHMVISEADGAIAQNLARKQADAERMSTEMIRHMSDLNRANLQATARTETQYMPRMKRQWPEWLTVRTEEGA